MLAVRISSSQIPPANKACPRKILQLFVHFEISRLPGGLGPLTDSYSIPWNPTTTYHPIQIAIIRLMSLLWHDVQLLLHLWSMICSCSMVPCCEHEHCASVFCVSTSEASPSESEFVLSEESASKCASRSSRLTVKGCNQTGMPCVGSLLFISFAGSRFSVACLSWSVSTGFPHARLSLRVVTGSDNGPNFL